MTRPTTAGPRRPLRAAAGLATAALLILLPTTPALAGIGVGVGAAPLRLPAPARPGGSYRLPALYVVNTGSQTSDYLVRVQPLGHLPGRGVPAAWVRLGRTQLRLNAHQHTLVPVSITIPDGAPAGVYTTDLVAATVTAGPRLGTAFGAAAADRLTFTVDAPGGGVSWLPGWLTYSLFALAAAGVAALAARRIGLRIRIERQAR